MEKLFSYGTLQQENVQMATFGRLLDGSPDSIIGFKQELLEIKDEKVIATSGKKLHPVVLKSHDNSEKISGTVFLVTAKELAQADKYEVSDYKRISARLESGDEAWVYVSNYE